MYLPAPTEGGSFTPVPAGTHLALCYRVVDLGTQKGTYKGEEKIAHKIMLSWEIPEERDGENRPLVISKFYTWSMHEKANLRKDLEAWRGAPFQERDFGPGGFDIRNIIGKACVLSIVQDAREGKTYSNIVSVGKPMKGMQVPELFNPPVYLWINRERWDASVFNALSQKLQETIRSSPEYGELLRGAESHDYPVPDDRDLNDDIPF